MYDISILVDTHSTKQREKQWQHEWGYISRFGFHSSASRGVAVLFKNSFQFHINQEIIDERGNFIILDINIQDYRMTLVATYGPNEDNPDFFKRLLFNIRSRRFRIEFGIPNEIIRKYSETAWKFGLCHFLGRKKCGNLNFVIFHVGKSLESWTLF
jgi:hypothetical protein